MTDYEIDLHAWALERELYDALVELARLVARGLSVDPGGVKRRLDESPSMRERLPALIVESVNHALTLPEERLARAAKQFTVAKLRGAGEIRLEHIERGSFFRLLAEVWIDGESLGQALIEAGHARPYVEGRTGKGWCE